MVSHPKPQRDAFQVFDPHQARTITAAVERIFPADPLGPGAADAGVAVYIDRALSGHDGDLRVTYRRGVEQLDEKARAIAACAFADAPPDVQDGVLAAMERDEPNLPPTPHGHPFFDTLLAHTREGLFSDPSYGGNRDMIGWKLLGYPGIQLHHPPEDFAPGAVLTSERMLSLADVGHDLRPGWMDDPGAIIFPHGPADVDDQDGREDTDGTPA